VFQTDIFEYTFLPVICLSQNQIFGAGVYIKMNKNFRFSGVQIRKYPASNQTPPLERFKILVTSMSHHPHWPLPYHTSPARWPPAPATVLPAAAAWDAQAGTKARAPHPS
jgi:hypothetical protein